TVLATEDGGRGCCFAFHRRGDEQFTLLLSRSCVAQNAGRTRNHTAMTCQTAVSLGVYVLGAADTSERLRVEAHLPGCAACRAELARLAPLPGLLARVPPDLRPASPGPAASSPAASSP